MTSDPSTAASPPTGSGTSAVDPDFADAIGADALFETLVQSASECFLVVDESDQVVFANPAVEDVFGYESEAVVGDRLVRLLPERFREEHLRGVAAYLRSGERTIDWDYVEFPGLHREGHEVPLALSFKELRVDGERYFVGIVRDVSERMAQREQLERERAFVESTFDALPDVTYAFDREGNFLRWNEEINDVTGYTDDEIASMHPLEFIADEHQARVVEAITRVLTEGTTETVEANFVTKAGREIPYEFTGGPLREDGEIVGQTGVGRDVSERRRREERLQRLDALNTVIRSVHDALIEATTRAEIETAVCDGLVARDAYVGAVMGRFDGEGPSFAADAAAGVDLAGVDGLIPAAEHDERSVGMAAVESGSIRTLADLDRSAVAARRAHARAEGYRAVAAVPVVSDDRRFGVLGVYSDRRDAFHEREVAILAELGEGIGDAIQDALTRELLYGNTVTEVELRSSDPGLAFVALSEAADCRIELDRALSFGDDLVFYVRIAGASPDAVEAAAAGIDDLDSLSHLGSNEGEHLFEFVAAEGTLTGLLTDHGARTVAAHTEGGVTDLVLEVPPGGDVRALVDALQSTYPETELVARREATRSLATPMEFREELEAEMTEKQRAALEAAYFAGYFDWPTRRSSAQEVAAMLGIAPQTFHQHLRIAEGKLLTALFDEERSQSPEA